MKHRLLLLALSIFTLEAAATISVDVKIEQKVDGNIIVSNQRISSDYNEDIVLTGAGMENKIILKLQKITQIKASGSSINPVQIDLKLIDDAQKLVGKSHTVTSFYNQSAEFNLPSNGDIENGTDLNVSLNFKENN
jgi:hypothetical protein